MKASSLVTALVGSILATSAIWVMGHPYASGGPERASAATTSAAAVVSAEPDTETLRANRGRPCHIATSDSGQRHIEMWSYRCIAGSIVGTETFTFVNDKLFTHTQL